MNEMKELNVIHVVNVLNSLIERCDYKAGQVSEFDKDAVLIYRSKSSAYGLAVALLKEALIDVCDSN